MNFDAFFVVQPSTAGCKRRHGLFRRGIAPLVLLVAFFVVACGVACPEALAAKLPIPKPPKLTQTVETLQQLAEKRIRTGVGMDAIAALYRPSFVSVSDASLSMEHDEVVFVVFYPTGLVRIYPQRIMVWHEVVNDVLPDPTGAKVRPDTPLSALDAFVVTYSPLTGTIAAYYGMAGRFPSTFGVTGELLNGNALIYDRMTGSTWCQLTGTCIDGPLIGKRLSPLPVYWATWRGARERFPDAQVLSRSTGYKRNYGRDPYGSYQRAGNYYDDLHIRYPLTHMDTRLAPKKRVLGIEAEGITGAIPVDAVKEAGGMLNIRLGLKSMVAIHDPVLDTVFLYESSIPGEEKPLSFSFLEGKIVDTNTKSEWGPDGKSTYGKHREKSLVPVRHVTSMWFAWSAFYPNTIILPETSFIRHPQ